MTYAIELVEIDKQELIIIDQEKIAHRMRANPFSTIMKANHHGFSIQPGRVFFDPTLTEMRSTEERKMVFRNLIVQGVTLVVTTCKISESDSIKKNIAKSRHAMINSPLDYVLGIIIDVKELTPKLMVELLKEKPPFILFSFQKWDEVYTPTWEWIRDTCINFKPLFIPLCENHTARPRELKKRLNEWIQFAKHINLPTLSPLSSEQPLTIGQLKALGIYPNKGVLRPGADCDYVLYSSLLEGDGPNLYDETTPSIVVIRGKVQFAGQDVYRPGYGREVKISMPNRFTDYWECMSKYG